MSTLLPTVSPPDASPDPGTRWRLIENLFHRASDLPAEARTAFLEQACAADPTLLPEVLELLHADSAVLGKVEAKKTDAPNLDAREPAAAGLSPSGLSPSGLSPSGRGAQPDREAEALTFRTSTDSWLGRTLGHYLVERELGRGGMGVVYLGRRTTPGPHGQAAIKVVRRNLQDSPALNHFLLERDALARLEHPNIARLLDGGVTPEGIPWLALEYVEGLRLDQYVERPETTVRTVLDLLIQLCAAVGYVHRNLILHRDLKPGNVMVTPEGVVKLLDFGTLKILESDEDSAMTQAGMRPLTLRFASPEHVHGHRVSTASDVYSLGIILYRLLAGRFPAPAGEPDAGSEGKLKPHRPFESPMAGFFEDLRADRFAPPSTFAALAMPAELARDLNAIVMKAIRYTPEDRYQTAEALAAELMRSLENEPVEARGNNRGYLARKFYIRHAAALWTAASALVVLFAALIVMAHETRLARVEQARAEVGVDQERKLAHLLLFDVTPSVELISTTPVKKEIVAKVSSYLDRLNAGPNPDPELQLYQVQGYTALSLVLGSPFGANLGDAKGAAREAEKAIALAEPLLRQEPGDLRVLQAQLTNYSLLGGIYLGNGDVPKAIGPFGKAEALEQVIMARHDLDAQAFAALAELENMLGELNWGSGRPSLSRPDLFMQHELRSIQLYNQALALQPHSLRSVLGIQYCDYQLGTFEEDTHPQLALGYFQQGLDLFARLTPEERLLPSFRRLARIMNDNLGGTETDVGLIPQGLARLGTAREQSRAAVAKDPLDEAAASELILLDLNFGAVFVKINRPREAIPLVQEAGALVRHLLLHHVSDELLLKQALSLLYLDIAASDAEEDALARPARSEGVPMLLALAAKPTASPAICLFAAHTLNRIGGDPQLSLSLARRAMLASNPGPDEWIERAIAEVRNGDARSAEADARQAEGLLSGTTGGYNMARKQQVAKVLHQPPPVPDPHDPSPVYKGKSALADFDPPQPQSNLPGSARNPKNR